MAAFGTPLQMKNIHISDMNVFDKNLSNEKAKPVGNKQKNLQQTYNAPSLSDG